SNYLKPKLHPKNQIKHPPPTKIKQIHNNPHLTPQQKPPPKHQLNPLKQQPFKHIHNPTHLNPIHQPKSNPQHTINQFHPNQFTIHQPKHKPKQPIQHPPNNK
ncbi:DUF1542 domain-containing protein, partial [Staphylococcus pasteuri]|uniref:DUF1542 domain-containing protein n=1 Tax=Staphylococcus pasteuri TaxID=45972 RepID=UPI0012B7F773